ncbi:FAD-binding oxidoreductase [Streptomyces sp. NPDC090442]|uniref:FAD-binding oxidoreductase n=1 Tax=Streptomyces sp. NPDC090442 TaxID=3365962 RepID=UPI00380B79F8
MAVSFEDLARAHGLDPARLVTEAGVPMWNAAVSSRAACDARCRTTADVQAAVRIAHALGLPLSVFSGGNDWLGRAVRDRGLVIDVSAMTTIEVDVEARTARIGGGVRSDVLARETESHGLTPVTGTVGLVHMLGLSLGGGYGPLDGRFGLACDNLVSAELVTADGSVRTVDAEHEPDLLWALRGGGGNFGVVTAAVVRLHRVGPVYGTAAGHVLHTPAAFMPLRSGTEAVPQVPDIPDGPCSDTELSGRVLDDWTFSFFAQLHMPAHLVRTYATSVESLHTTTLHDPADGSTTIVKDMPARSPLVFSEGPRDLWQPIEAAHDLWQELNRPRHERFTPHATPTEQTVTYTTPGGRTHRWSL